MNSVTATSELSIPLPLSESRSGPLSKPSLSLSYSSGNSNGIFGYGWRLGLETVHRKQNNRIPTYTDSDIFQLGGEDLVPRLDLPDTIRNGYSVRSFYRRTESAYDRIERWSSRADASDVFWRRITGDNVTTAFGDSSLSRVSDPADPTRTLHWLISASWDAVGNAIYYSYVGEDSVNVDVSSLCESRRTSADRTANRYLSCVSYGNRVSSRSGQDFAAVHPRDLKPEQWMFRLIVDYGDFESTDGWACRQDPFSTHSAGFEVRTYRLCERILMLHYFPDFVKTDSPGFLVNSISFTYSSSPLGTLLQSATMAGHSPLPGLDGRSTGAYESKAMPPVAFSYSTPSDPSEYAAQRADPQSIGPYPISNKSSGQWLDLYGTGIPGFLAKEDDTLYWRDNNSPLTNTVVLGEPRAVYKLPDDNLLSAPPELSDVEGSGRPSLLMGQGFVPQSEPGTWDEYRPFSQTVQFDPEHRKNLVHLDLTGDGLADMLFVTDGAFVWSQSLGKDGYGPIRRVSFLGAQEASAAFLLGFSDQPSLFLADMSGDGLLDLVAVKNGRVEYFPNLGYGVFGKKVAMDHAPWFDDPDNFSPSSIRFADVDGNGTQDVIYLPGDGGADLYRNLSGNAFAARERITALPPMTSSAKVDTLDLLGKGTACLVWTSSLPSSDQELQYIDLAPAGKPYLMMSYNNGLGLETSMEYVASTKFFLEDRQAGVDWATRLAFPVQCLHKVITYDRVTQSKKTQRLRYRHGFWDMFDREFRGFGFVESWDGEDLSAAGHDDVQMPVSSVAGGITHTKSWFHTGLDAEQDKVARAYRDEFCSSVQTALPTLSLSGELSGLAIAELRGVYRALAGHAVRKETYGAGVYGKPDIPYSVTENSYSAVVVQLFRAANSPAVVRVDAAQDMTTTVEQDAATPRVSHSMVLALDDWGNPTRSVAISYGLPASSSNKELPQAVQGAQGKTRAVLTISRYTNAVDETNDFLRPVLFEQASYEVQDPESVSPLSPLTPTSSRSSEWRAFDESIKPRGSDYRLLSKSRNLFRGKNLEPLPAGKLDSLGIPLTTYKLAVTADMLQDLFLDGTRPLLETSDVAVGGYEDLDSDGQLWIGSGRRRFSQHDSSLEDELQVARSSFFTPISFLDVFGTASVVKYDDDHMCLVGSTDAVGNETSCFVDYRVLQPWKATDINGNVTEVTFDALGIPVATALVGGPGSGENMLNSLDGIVVDPGEVVISSFLAQPTTEAALDLLKKASSRVVYRAGLDGIVQATIAREQDALVDKAGRVQVTVKYTSGGGASVQTMKLYEEKTGAPSTWLASGWATLDHRGHVVKQFEPFFDSSSALNRNTGTVCTSVYLLDGLGRSVVLLSANGLWSKTERGPWSETSRDAGDLVDEDLFADPVSNESLRRLGVSPRASWKSGASQAAAAKSQAYSQTPHRSHLDPLGRRICTESIDSAGRSLFAFTETDIQGRVSAVFDEIGRQVARYDYDMAGRCCKQTLMDTGPSWSFFDAVGATIVTWTNRRAKVLTTYDLLRRPTAKTVVESPGGSSRVIERLVYGDDDEAGVPRNSNLRGKVFKIYDQAGVAVNEAFGPRGELLSSTRQHAEEFKSTVDWTDPNGPKLNTATYRSLRDFDAIGRQRSYKAADGSVQRSEYAQSGHLRTLALVASGRDETDSSFVITGTNYNARGQQTVIQYGNGASSKREYDKLSFLCTRIYSADGGGRVLQDLNYDFDCMGKIISNVDNSQQDTYFNNAMVAPRTDYTYNHLGRLLSATGREQIGRKAEPSPTLAARNKTTLLVDSGTMTNYTESYKYDDAGNMLQVVHVSDVSSAGWTTNYTYAEPSLLEPGKTGNRLTSTATSTSTENYGYGGKDGSDGCMTRSEPACLCHGVPCLQSADS